jgi:peptidyl-tRNA hydrolase
MKVTDNHRIYVVMPKTIDTHKGTTMQLPCGMAAAQAAHAVSKLRLMHVKRLKNGLEQMDKPITTIVLQCRDTKELQHVERLAGYKNIPFAAFLDTNDFLYLKGSSVHTATAFGPCTKEQAQEVLDYLPLWGC